MDNLRKVFRTPVGALEAGASLLSGAVAEPVAGWAGILSGGNANKVEATRKAMTYQPRTEAGQDSLQGIGDIIGQLKDTVMASPVGSVVNGYNSMADSLGARSPALGAAAKTLPGAAAMLLGPGGTATRQAFGNVARDSATGAGRVVAQAADNAASVPAMRGPMAAQDGIFAGHLSKDAPIWKLEQAKTLKAWGNDDRTVYDKTGWFDGSADGMWRYEIPDNKAEFDTDALTELREIAQDSGRAFDPLKDTTPLAGVLGHKELYSAYPDTADIPVHFLPKERMRGADGAYSLKHDRLTLKDDMDAENSRSVALHEIQHAIQQREGFARGGSPNSMPLEFEDMAAKAKQEARQLYEQAYSGDPLNPGDLRKPGALKKSLAAEKRAAELRAQQMHMEQFPSLANDAYKRLAGEAEARLVQSRMNMTPAERAKSYPLDMLDVPVSEQIVRFGGNGEQMAIGGNGPMAKVLADKYPEVDGYLSEYGDRPAVLSKIVVPPETRGQGTGSAFMRDLSDLADQEGKTVALSPSGDFGGSKPRLQEFYKRFGYVPNKGRTKDYEISESMYRIPKPK